MRDGENCNAEEAARLAGISAAHEIGRQLFHFLHPFGQSACLMNPVDDLPDFQQPTKHNRGKVLARRRLVC